MTAPMTDTRPPTETARRLAEDVMRTSIDHQLRSDADASTREWIIKRIAMAVEALITAAKAETATAVTRERTRIADAIEYNAGPGSVHTEHGKYVLRVEALHIRDGQHWNIANMDDPPEPSKQHDYYVGIENAAAAEQLHEAERRADRLEGKLDAARAEIAAAKAELENECRASMDEIANLRAELERAYRRGVKEMEAENGHLSAALQRRLVAHDEEWAEQARREGAEEMREQAAAACKMFGPDDDRLDRQTLREAAQRIRNLPLPPSPGPAAPGAAGVEGERPGSEDAEDTANRNMSNPELLRHNAAALKELLASPAARAWPARHFVDRNPELTALEDAAAGREAPQPAPAPGLTLIPTPPAFNAEFTPPNNGPTPQEMLGVPPVTFGSQPAPAPGDSGERLRPISTIPQDGREFLLFTNTGVISARWSPGTGWTDSPTSGRDYDGPALVCYDDAFSIDVEEGPDGPHVSGAIGWLPLPIPIALEDAAAIRRDALMEAAQWHLAMADTLRDATWPAQQTERQHHLNSASSIRALVEAGAQEDIK